MENLSEQDSRIIEKFEDGHKKIQEMYDMIFAESDKVDTDR